MRALHGVIAAAVCAFASAAWAQSADPAVGRRLAELVCNACHQIDAEVAQPGPNARAPSFASISRSPSTNELALKVFLRTSHAEMPNIMLTAEETNSVIAYILGLAAK